MGRLPAPDGVGSQKGRASVMTIQLTITLKKRVGTATALTIAEQAAEHLMDTFNDDGSLKKIEYGVVKEDGRTERILTALREWADECNEIAKNVLIGEESESYETKAREIEQLIREIEGS